MEMKHAEIMTDDEGTPADVTASIALSRVRAHTLSLGRDFAC